jgi:hypothetical protein
MNQLLLVKNTQRLHTGVTKEVYVEHLARGKAAW